jgi:hypothetical protein
MGSSTKKLKMLSKKRKSIATEIHIELGKKKDILSIQEELSNLSLFQPPSIQRNQRSSLNQLPEQLILIPGKQMGGTEIKFPVFKD